MEDKLYTVKEVAVLKEVNEETVRRWIRSGRLRTSKIGREFVISAWDLDTFGYIGDTPSYELSNIGSSSMNYPGAFPFTMFLDDAFFAIEKQWERMQQDNVNIQLGLNRQQQELSERMLIGKPRAPLPYWSIPQRVLFMDIHFYFVCCEKLRKILHESTKSINNIEFTNLVQPYDMMLGKFEVIRGMLEHPEKQVRNKKIAGDLGNIDDKGFRFGNKHYDFCISEVRTLRTELKDFFVLAAAPEVK